MKNLRSMKVKKKIMSDDNISKFPSEEEIQSDGNGSDGDESEEESL